MLSGLYALDASEGKLVSRSIKLMNPTCENMRRAMRDKVESAAVVLKLFYIYNGIIEKLYLKYISNVKLLIYYASNRKGGV